MNSINYKTFRSTVLLLIVLYIAFLTTSIPQFSDISVKKGFLAICKIVEFGIIFYFFLRVTTYKNETDSIIKGYDMGYYIGYLEGIEDTLDILDKSDLPDIDLTCDAEGVQDYFPHN